MTATPFEQEQEQFNEWIESFEVNGAQTLPLFGKLETPAVEQTEVIGQDAVDVFLKHRPEFAELRVQLVAAIERPFWLEKAK